TDPGAAGTARTFRTELYGCLGRRGDPLFELVDDAAYGGPAESLPHSAWCPATVPETLRPVTRAPEGPLRPGASQGSKPPLLARLTALTASYQRSGAVDGA